MHFAAARSCPPETALVAGFVDVHYGAPRGIDHVLESRVPLEGRWCTAGDTLLVRHAINRGSHWEVVFENLAIHVRFLSLGRLHREPLGRALEHSVADFTCGSVLQRVDPAV